MLLESQEVISFYPNASEELKNHLLNFKETLRKCESIGLTVEEVSIDKKILDAIPFSSSLTIVEPSNFLAGPVPTGKINPSYLVNNSFILSTINLLTL